MHQEVKTSEEFDAAISAGCVLVDFWAPWCGPCQMMGQLIDSDLAAAMPEIKVVKVNVDEAPELAAKFGVMSIPALFCFKDGAKTGEFTGVTPVAKIIEKYR
ncbi:MAG: thioredoxin family protein [Kiritimatiellae bacterium]|jgi:thioredoxin 1|nr:thioredoxin family protein [Kiritimatiellia bacterium]